LFNTFQVAVSVGIAIKKATLKNMVDDFLLRIQARAGQDT
jgi:hypothetical protein